MPAENRRDPRVPLRLRIEFLDVDAGTEAATLGTNDNHVHSRRIAEAFDLIGQRMPAGIVQRIYRRTVDDQLGDAFGDLGFERSAHADLAKDGA